MSYGNFIKAVRCVITTLTMFKKKWKPALRETLIDGEELTFEPSKQNRHVILGIRERVPRKRKKERKKDTLRM